MIPFPKFQPDLTKALTERLRGVDRDYWIEADFDEEVAAWDRVESDLAQKTCADPVGRGETKTAAHPLNVRRLGSTRWSRQALTFAVQMTRRLASLASSP
jgi:hypothetical protein